MNELDSAFGKLRALMQSPTQPESTSLLQWLTDMEASDPNRYHTQWVPYLASFPHHWITSLATVDTIERLEHVVRVAPFALFTFDGSAWTGLRRHAHDQGKIPPRSYPPGFLNAYGFNDEKIARLVLSPALERVVHLNLVWGNLTHEGIQTLANCPSLTNLKTLELRYHYNITDLGIDALLHSPYITQLEHLDLSQTSSTAQGFIALASSPFVQHLKTLAFWNNVNQTSIAQAFNASTSLTQLTNLSLSDTTNKDICNILNSPNAGALQTFEFDAMAPMTPTDIQTIGKSPHIGELHTLSLANLEISTPHLEQLANSQNLTALHTLNLSTNHVTTEGIEHLARAPWINQITSLDLSYNPLDTNAFEPLTTTQFKPTHLILNQDWDHPVEAIDEALAAWFATSSSTNLQHLELRCAPLSKSLIALGAATHITQLNTLDLRYATVDPNALIALIQSPVSRTIQKIDLTSVWDEQEASTTALCQALKDTAYLTQLTHLTLDDLSMTDDALILLSQSSILNSVTHLEIEGQYFSDEALQHFASSPYLTNLVELSIDLLDDHTENQTAQHTILCQSTTLPEHLRAYFNPTNHLEEIW